MNKGKKTNGPQLQTLSIPRHEQSGIPSKIVMHRIVLDDLVGAWHTYQQVATLKTPTGVLHACTDYFHGSLPTNCVFRVAEIV